jgi:endonuclease III
VNPKRLLDRFRIWAFGDANPSKKSDQANRNDSIEETGVTVIFHDVSPDVASDRLKKEIEDERTRQSLATLKKRADDAENHEIWLAKEGRGSPGLGRKKQAETKDQFGLRSEMNAPRSPRAGPPAAPALLIGLQQSLRMCGVDYEQTIKDFGQVAASEDRERGRHFSLTDHVRGLLLSQLSNQRPWKPIAQNRDRIRRIFHDYDPDALERANPRDLANSIMSIRCGNRAIVQQMNALASNITNLRRIETDYAGLDKFVSSRHPLEIAKLISAPGPYKLACVGPALALEYLRNVGIRAAKPDLHVLRILGGERLSYSPGKLTERDAVELVSNLAIEAGCNATYLDNLLWLFCAEGYGEICGARPRCNICAFRDSCRYPKQA